MLTFWSQYKCIKNVTAMEYLNSLAHSYEHDGKFHPCEANSLLAGQQAKKTNSGGFWASILKNNVFSWSLQNYFSYWQAFLAVISTLTGFHDWDLVIRRALRVITSNYYLLSTLKDQSMMRAELTGVVVGRGMRTESAGYGHSTQY